MAHNPDDRETDKQTVHESYVPPESLQKSFTPPVSVQPTEQAEADSPSEGASTSETPTTEEE